MRFIYRYMNWVIAFLIFALLLLPTGIQLYGEYLWFAAAEYLSVFTTILSYQVGLFVAATLVAGLLLYGSYRWTTRNLAAAGDYTARSWTVYALAGVAVFTGFAAANEWDMVLRFLYATTFPLSDPVFNNNTAFYVFTFPLLKTGVFYLFFLTLIAAAMAVLRYATVFGVERPATTTTTTAADQSGTMRQTPVQTAQFSWPRFKDRAYQYASTHLGLLFGFLFLLLAAYLVLARYDLLFSSLGAVNGAGFTDTVIRLPVLTALAGLSAATAAAFLVNMYWQREKWVYLTVGLLAGLYVVGMGAATVTQTYFVEPDEFNKEESHLKDDIRFTRSAYDLEQVMEEDYDVSKRLPADALNRFNDTVRNVRLWDWQPLKKTYNELQIFRTYYNFPHVDVDRYTVDGEKTAVMLAAREMDTSALPEESQTWVNKHLVYTHGYGVAMSPVRGVTPEGSPRFYVKDIPPNISVNGVTLSQPRLYYGESMDNYVITDTETRELDYPRGDHNAYTSYTGGGGVQLDSVWKKVVYAVVFGDQQIFFSGSITDESRILLHRQVQDRVKTIAPFLTLDKDPYTVVADGSVYYIQDAYTTTSKYPYANPSRFNGEETRYIRNSVKVVVDAYTGETRFYVAEEEPIIETYRDAFPELFTDMSNMPMSLKQHIRYPEDLFTVQMKQYATYHMQDPQVFYNKEDAWRFPREIARGNEKQMEPYYVVMQMPGNREPEFVQILPFIPEGRENMIGWVAARSDPAVYGNITAFQLTKQQLIFGPMQVESRIDQDTDISQRITLWSQTGSSVFRGNLLALPIADTMLYVEPLFLQSRESGSLPQLKRVIVAQGDRLAMKPTLDQALDALYNRTVYADTGPRQSVQQPLTDETMAEARRLYQEARQALRNGNFTLYSQKIDALGDVLNQEK